MSNGCGQPSSLCHDQCSCSNSSCCIPQFTCVRHQRVCFVLVCCVVVLCTATQAGVKLISLPSKRLGLYTTAASTIIARSDSNGEDLEAFAGAGMQTSFAVLFVCASRHACTLVHFFDYRCSSCFTNKSHGLHAQQALANVWGVYCVTPCHVL